MSKKRKKTSSWVIWGPDTIFFDILRPYTCGDFLKMIWIKIAKQIIYLSDLGYGQDFFEYFEAIYLWWFAQNDMNKNRKKIIYLSDLGCEQIWSAWESMNKYYKTWQKTDKSHKTHGKLLIFKMAIAHYRNIRRCVLSKYLTYFFFIRHFSFKLRVLIGAPSLCAFMAPRNIH